MDARSLRSDQRVLIALITLSCFLLTSTGWLLWLYHLMVLAAPDSVDLLTMGVGYLMQAIGIGGFILLERNGLEARTRHSAAFAIIAYAVCLVPAALAPALAPALAFGYLANLFCGYIQGLYLSHLAQGVNEGHRGIVFGSAYAASTGLGWVLSSCAHGALVRGVPGLVLCFVLSIPSVLLVRRPIATLEKGPGKEHVPDDSRTTLLLACAVVTLMSLTKGIGFSFPTSQLIGGINLELSRLLYGLGLLVAGLLSDRDRRLGALCCAAALTTPFFMLALAGAVAPATLMWALGYLLNGFFSVFRVLVLADLSASSGRPMRAGLGLACGRVGDALGTVLTSMLTPLPLALVLVAAVSFACTTALFFVLYNRLYVPTPEPAPTEREVFERFAARHDLSGREREVLRLLLDERSNSEIAAQLFVSEATVKFHVRNLLKKTGCKNRLEILALYGGVER